MDEPRTNAAPAAALSLFIVAGGLPLFSGCTLWKVLNPELLPSRNTTWTVVEEHYEATGRYRYVPAVIATTSGPGLVDVRGTVTVEAEKKPWFVYRGERDFHREVESILTCGEIERVFHVTDPPGRPGGDGDPFDLGLGIIPLSEKRSTRMAWMEEPTSRYPRCALQWNLTSESGEMLGFGQEIAAPSGHFEIRLPWDVVRRVRRSASPQVKLTLESEDPAQTAVFRIDREVFEQAAREAEG